MSHFTAVVLVDPRFRTSKEIGEEAERLLAPFNENTRVPPYEEECYCVRNRRDAEAGKAARLAAGSPAEDAESGDGKGEEETCGECEGRGVISSTYNPNSKWDWYRVGGRWDGSILEHLPTDLAAARNLTDAVSRNSARAGDLLPGSVSYAIITPDGEWIARGKMGWFGMSRDEKDDWDENSTQIFRAYPDHTAVLYDLHI